MSDYNELKRLVEQGSLPPIVATLIAENERLKSDLFESNDLVEHLGDKRKALTAERDQLKAEVESLGGLIKRSHTFVAFAFDHGMEGAEDVGRDMDNAMSKGEQS